MTMPENRGSRRDVANTSRNRRERREKRRPDVSSWTRRRAADGQDVEDDGVHGRRTAITKDLRLGDLASPENENRPVLGEEVPQPHGAHEQGVEDHRHRNRVLHRAGEGRRGDGGEEQDSLGFLLPQALSSVFSTKSDTTREHAEPVSLLSLPRDS